MAIMCQKALFEMLGAPLVNTRWSWGAIRAADGVVFLRVLEDNIKNIDGKDFMRLTKKELFESKPRKNPGHLERLRHVGAVESGAKCYMVICIAKDVMAVPREVLGFNNEALFLGGKLIEHQGDAWLEIVDRVAVNDTFS
jgi:hypothetical protein